MGIVGDRGDKKVFQMLSGAIEHVAHHLGFIVERKKLIGDDQSLAWAFIRPGEVR
jgi:hypothetical protein